MCISSSQALELEIFIMVSKPFLDIPNHSCSVKAGIFSRCWAHVIS